MTYFVPPPPPDAMLMSGIQVIFGRFHIAWGKGEQKKLLVFSVTPFKIDQNKKSKPLYR